MDDKEMDQVIRRKVQKAVEKSLAEAWDDPFWAQLEELEDDVRLPPIDVQDHDDHFLLVAEMPGVPKEHVGIKVTENSVEVSGESALECDIDAMETAYLCNERATTGFHRKVPLPRPVVPGDAEASMKMGVLTLKLPKKSESAEEAVTVSIA
ncbi:MAG: Hsp20 family protein [Thermoplasmata archaeon]|nr:Hsp20/alpha crystallin family protein [Thermoplasmata archaeon]NIS13339.1 Hsp20/alpha crystallin family protein [Thermoplasmata archaeon]NIS21231.1 Hsp20/alpha crystallin family protein [Thermoplasmata archaeon]NIT78728.1 Hsp20/alpha crystallin family protein [Thermoplasmata archaeon]NIU50284.1 Hsp20/alpha crystallin family protein [Thermoplasmata archaeon]